MLARVRFLIHTALERGEETFDGRKRKRFQRFQHKPLKRLKGLLVDAFHLAKAR